jgi:hypothetical protein
VLTVVAPPATRFAIGTGLGDSTPLNCAASIATEGSPTTYHVVCPASTADELLSTTSYRAFDYGFAKPL